MTSLPSAARAVIVGGGIVGCSVAYHLTKLGWRDVVVLEQGKLTSGSTFHAAGLVGQLRTSANITRLLTESVALYQRLEAETGQATGWKQNGGLRLACNKQRLTEIKRQATTAHSFGLEMHILTPQEARDLWPVMAIDDLEGAAFLPTDGQANPSDIALALAKGARGGGAKFIEGVKVTAILQEKGRATGVVVDSKEAGQGTIKAEVVVNCAGQWARALGKLAGVRVPLVSVQHQYVITEVVPGVPRNLPTLRDPDRLIYFKEEVGGLVFGGYEPNPIPWADDGIPDNWVFQLLPNDFDHFEPLMEQALARVPALATAGIKQMINGPESFTPDGNFILGEAPELKNFYVGAGFNAFGIASAGGAGKALAEWVAAGEPPMDLWPVDIRRFGRPHDSVAWTRARTMEAYAKHYTMAWPFEEHRSGRPNRVSPLYATLKEQGAVFGEKLGWERPNWFARKADKAEDVYSYGRQNWFDAVGEEHRAVREAAGLFDQSSFAKFLVQGPDAEAALSWICANDVAKPPGSLTYTQLLNRKGGIQCDLTVARLSDESFYIVTGTGFATHDFSWIQRSIPEGARAALTDVTSAYGVLSLMGPKSREILQGLSKDDLSKATFPFGSCRWIEIGTVRALALRVTYVGELGWELHVPTEQMLAAYRLLMEAGAPLGLRNAGYRAIESLRLEKGYRAWAADIGPDYSPLEAGMAWAVKLKRNIDFQGRAALTAQQQKPLARRLACFTVEGRDTVLLGRETIYRDGQRVGWLASAGWGYTVGKNIGYGYVRRADGVDDAFLYSGAYELEVASERVPCRIERQVLWDPTNARIKA
jgi:sarcosine dehydrogenase